MKRVHISIGRTEKLCVAVLIGIICIGLIFSGRSVSAADSYEEVENFMQSDYFTTLNMLDEFWHRETKNPGQRGRVFVYRVKILGVFLLYYIRNKKEKRSFRWTKRK